MRDKEQLKKIWEEFVYEGKQAPALNEIVRESWLRSLSLGVDPFQEKGKDVLPKHELQRLQKYNHSLIETSLPLMDSLYSIVKGSDFLVILCDKDGRLIKVIGDAETLDKAEKINFVEGADWSEKNVGTNAIGTAIAIDKPIQIFASEHYSKSCHPWTCSASPIHDTSGNILGVLNMSGSFEKVHSHTLGMVVSTVKAIENQLEIQEKTQKNKMMKSLLEATTDTLSDGMLIIDRNGVIIKTNRKLHEIVGLREEYLLGKPVNHVFANKTFSKIVETSLEVQDKELKLKMINPNGNSIHVLINSKPIFQQNRMIGNLVTVKEFHKVRQFINHLSGNQAKVTFEDIIGNSTALLRTKEEAMLAAKSESNVLLIGESGTGKDIFAQAIHNESRRSKKPFIAINCGGIPRDLLGSELFGYEEGAFTGARKGGSAGKFELADGGTLFLDEIGEMSLEMQVLLLRVLQEKVVVRIGGHRVIPADVRIIAATNKNLQEEVKKGSFREDLFFRLNVIPLMLPPLRERKEDIPLLVKYFLSKLSSRLDKTIDHISSQFIQQLMAYQWPGNVRELQNILERSIVRTKRNILEKDTLPEELQISGMNTSEIRIFHKQLPKKDEIKREALIHSIRLCEGNYSRAAKYLGISRSTLYRQMDKFGIR
ncbi:sigma-54-dependent Fis family transcriptional regulator [Tepidibacillus infernus]|uniref:Diguanylate cyclase n=1 Tax=Tepidibacillus decaturensis TaxID=1413211 RepID=A0A135L1W6_9BACI|nr:sigma-54-dependent Fis family transcriptional regulator [Tepidibacillus decaturensis]KXG42998.1 diguanylate cyclase [Tepidibacillus decaturensis]